MPQKTPAASDAGVKMTVPNAKELKKQWNQQVCGPAPAAVDACVVR